MQFFEVNIHAETQGTTVIMGNKHLLEKYPNMYQHEIAVMAVENSESFPLLAITNLDHIKTLHLKKGEVVGFAKPESPEVTYIATTNELNIEEMVDVNARFIRPIACVGSGDPVTVLHLYTTNTLDEV